MPDGQEQWFAAGDQRQGTWTGRVAIDPPSGEASRFEMVRQVTPKQLYANPFADAATITGLLDFQTPFTLLKPFVDTVQPGQLSTGNTALTTKLGGSAQEILVGAAVADPSEPMFKSFSFESDAFRSWLAPALSGNPAPGSADITINTDDRIEGFGRLICRGGTKAGSNLWSRHMRTAAMFAIVFDAPQSLDDIVARSYACDRLIGFLVGARLKPPEISLERSEQHREQPNARLRLTGLRWTDAEPPFNSECPHSRLIGDVALPQLVRTFLTNEAPLLAAIDAVEIARFFASDIVEKFRVVMPVLEETLMRLFKSPAEADHLDRQTAYWAWFEAHAPAEFAEFSRKHLKVTNGKSPDLTTLLSRAIAAINTCGFNIPSVMARRIKARRASLFHSAAHVLTSEDALAFALETRAATLLLLLLTFQQLGLDVARLAPRPEALPGFHMFMVPQRASPSSG